MLTNTKVYNILIERNKIMAKKQVKESDSVVQTATPQDTAPAVAEPLNEVAYGIARSNGKVYLATVRYNVDTGQTSKVELKEMEDRATANANFKVEVARNIFMAGQ